MKDNIIEKIKAILQKHPYTESQICHLMVLIRKRIEHIPKDEQKKYQILKFFCDWVLHVKIDRSEISKNILKTIRQCINESEKRLHDLDFQEKSRNKIREAISIEKLYNEMLLFFKQFNLPLKPISNLTIWQKILKLLKVIIRDCPLQLTQNTIVTELKIFYFPNFEGDWLKIKHGSKEGRLSLSYEK